MPKKNGSVLLEEEGSKKILWTSVKLQGQQKIMTEKVIEILDDLVSLTITATSYFCISLVIIVILPAIRRTSTSTRSSHNRAMAPVSAQQQVLLETNA